MNWNKIKEKYPKSEALIDKCIRTDRDLYDFFDEQGIYIGIGVPLPGQDFWDAKITTPEDYKYIHSTFPTRTEAEEKAFERAFELLESKVA